MAKRQTKQSSKASAEIAAKPKKMTPYEVHMIALKNQYAFYTAIVTTKLPILLGGAFGPFHPPGLKSSGFWAMAHEARTDWSMLLGAFFLLLVGSGPWSVDARRARRLPASGGISR